VGRGRALLLGPPAAFIQGAAPAAYDERHRQTGRLRGAQGGRDRLGGPSGQDIDGGAGAAARDAALSVRPASARTDSCTVCSTPSPPRLAYGLTDRDAGRPRCRAPKPESPSKRRYRRVRRVHFAAIVLSIHQLHERRREPVLGVSRTTPAMTRDRHLPYARTARPAANTHQEQCSRILNP
jgi:hypothetical protein